MIVTCKTPEALWRNIEEIYRDDHGNLTITCVHYEDDNLKAVSLKKELK